MSSNKYLLAFVLFDIVCCQGAIQQLSPPKPITITGLSSNGSSSVHQVYGTGLSSKGMQENQYYLPSRPLAKPESNNGLTFTVGQRLGVYDSSNRLKEFVEVRVLANHDNCLGVTSLENETVILQCPGKEPKEGCVHAILPESESLDNTVERKEICAEYVNFCRRLTISNNTIILFNCPITPYSETYSINYNGPPPRM